MQLYERIQLIGGDASWTAAEKGVEVPFTTNQHKFPQL